MSTVKGAIASTIIVVSLVSMFMQTSSVTFFKEPIAMAQLPTATITLMKIVFNNEGQGNKTPSDFTLTINGTGVAQNTPITVGANKPQTINENTPSFNGTFPNTYYKFGIAGAGCPTVFGGTVILNQNQNITCTLFNTQQITPIDYNGLIIIKNVINDNGGNAISSDFTLKVNNTGGITSFSQTFLGSAVGTLLKTPNDADYFINEVAVQGYASTITGQGCPANLGVGFHLIKNERIICTITNNDIAPKLTVTKVVVNDSGGTKVVADFPLKVDSTTVTSGAQNTFSAGAHTVSETSQAGYAGEITGDCAANGTITLNLGDVKSCTISNNDQQANLTVSHFQAVINGPSEVDPTTSSATGFGSFSYDDTTNVLTYDISFSGLSSPETGAHIHQAPVGFDGPIIFGLPAGSPKNGAVMLNPSQKTSLFAGQLYVNIHSTNFSGGEIRGQILILSAGDCVVSSGDWIIQQSCNLASSATAPANVVVQNGAVLTITSGKILNIDFANHHLLVQSGGGVLIKAGGKIS